MSEKAKKQELQAIVALLCSELACAATKFAPGQELAI
ncbi:unnamed protein product, partial [Wuchereria bancrofti]